MEPEVWPDRFPGEPPRRGIGPVGVLALVVVCTCAGVLGALGTVEWLDRSQNAAPTHPRTEELTLEINELEARAAQLRSSVHQLAELEADALAGLRAVQEEVPREAAAESEQQVLEELQRELERAQAAPTPTAEAPPPPTTLHPKVISDAEAVVAGVIDRYSHSWPWLQTAWDASDVTFFEQLPEPCAGAAGCLSGARLWLTLDAVLSEDTVLHELGHVWNNLVPPTGFSEPGRVPWPLVQAMFYEHYAGCHSPRAGTDRLGEELLVDAMVLAADPSKAPLLGGYGYYENDDFTDFWGDGGFSGCLVDSAEPPEHLTEAIFAALYNCEPNPNPEPGTRQFFTSNWQRMADRLAVSVCQDIQQDPEAN